MKAAMSAALARLRLTMKDANKIAMRKLSPMKAITLLRLKVSGDMSQAIKIAGYFNRPLPEDLFAS